MPVFAFDIDKEVDNIVFTKLSTTKVTYDIRHLILWCQNHVCITSTSDILYTILPHILFGIPIFIIMTCILVKSFEVNRLVEGCPAEIYRGVTARYNTPYGRMFTQSS